MKKTQRDTFVPAEDFEDLTLFVNESFDTKDVDLFEFTSEESSPLTQLKAIILSLDWEITDEILQELADEVFNLQSMWQGDKVAEVYLQGLGKIGQYIRAKGGYAHPNSIKLLLTFYYNFEKILSSPHITGDQITQLLKGDIRKFKILQYQIAQSEQVEQQTLGGDLILQNLPSGQTVAEGEDVSPPLLLKASILGLDWEVTEENLLQFNTQLAACHQLMADNKPALILLQGLQALGDYIAEERADSHPDAFTLLHSFYEAFEQVAQSGDHALGQGEVQELLVDRVNRLNTLKMLLASAPAGAVDEEHIAEVVDQLSTPVVWTEQPEIEIESGEDAASASALSNKPTASQKEGEDAIFSLGAEIDSLFGLDAKPAMETADVQYPDEILPPEAIHPVENQLADDLIGAQFNFTSEYMPALADADETTGFNADETTLDLPTQNDLAEQLDFLFTDAEEYPEVPPMEPASFLAGPLPSDMETDTALAGVDISLPESVDDDQDTEGSFLEESNVNNANMLDIESKLDRFFADINDESFQPEPDAPIGAQSGQSCLADTSTGPSGALADAKELGGFSEEEALTALGYSSLDAIEERLDFFFGQDVHEKQLPDPLDKIVLEEEPAPALIEVVPDTGEEKEEIDLAPAAVSDGPDEAEAESDMSDITFALDDFTPDTAEQEIACTAALSEVVPETDDEHNGLAPALSGFVFEAANAAYPDATDTTTGEEKDDSELEHALNVLFASEDSMPAAEPVVTGSSDALTEALAASLDEEHDTSVDQRPIQLAALGAMLPMAVRSLDREKMAEAGAILTTLQQSGWSGEHQAVAQLLQSVVTMLSRLPAKSETDTEKLVNYLYEQLLQESLLPSVLVTAIERFSRWLQQAGSLMPLVPSTLNEEGRDRLQEPQFHYTAKELYFELAELRLHMKKEFAELRHEMQHHH